jgi:glycosyltransferase involved in cell wall biosynthesis
MTSRYRVLVIAEAANPEWVSVPLVGWSIVNALRDVADVHLITQIRNKDAIERAGLVEGRDFTAIDSEAVMKPLWKFAELIRGGQGKGWTTVQAIKSLSYPLFEHMIWKRFGKRIRAGEFDVVHRVTPLSPTSASIVAARCAKAGVPFVMGPLNGGVPWPEGYGKERQKEREWLSYVRNAYKLMPSIRRTWRTAAAIVVGSKHTRSELPPEAQAKSIFIPENAIDPARFGSARVDPERYARLSLCFIGRLVPYKGPDIAIIAAQDLLRSGAATLTVIGDGPMMAELKALAAELGVADAVRFTGWLAHGDVPAEAGKHGIFLFPSVREFGGGAVIEGMALGMIPIVANYGGPGEIVTDDSGFRLPIGPRESLIESARVLLTDMAAGRYDLATLAANGIERVGALFTWERKAAQLLDVYDWAAGKRPDKPEFPFFAPLSDSARGESVPAE